MNKALSVKRTFIKSPESAASIRADLIIALIPSVIWAVIRFGTNAFVLMAASVISAAVTDIVFTFISDRRFRLPSVYTCFCSLIFALTLYGETSCLIAVTGGLLTVMLIKVMGGDGSGFIFAPVLARILTFQMLPYRICMPADMPLDILLSGELPNETFFDMMLGMENGAIGTVSIIAILMGFIYLAVRRNTDFKVSVSFIIVSFALSFFLPAFEGRGMESAVFELISGESVFAAVFILTDHASTPLGNISKILKGVICAVFMFGLRGLGYASESVFLAVLFTNIITYTVSTVYNKAKEVKNAK